MTNQNGGDGWKTTVVRPARRQPRVQQSQAGVGDGTEGATISYSTVGCTAVINSRTERTAADIKRTLTGAVITGQAHDSLKPDELKALDAQLTDWYHTTYNQFVIPGRPGREISGTRFDHAALRKAIAENGSITVKVSGHGAQSTARDTEIELPKLPGNPLNAACTSKSPGS